MKLRKTNPTDYDLVKQYIDGNPDSIDILINRHKDRLYTYIYLIVKNHQLTEDLFQDTFIKVIRSLRLGKYQDNGKFLAWVLRIAHNLIIDHFRRVKQNNTFSKDDYELDIFNSAKFSDSNCEDELIKHQIYADIRELVEELPADQKEVVILRHYKGLSFKDIAEQTDVSINTALGRMRYALINMRKIIEERKMSLVS
ncbi:RNA polymerase sigma factor [Ancylomarina longa]|uniref:Sigma-70 family RNA polymerase sigma factor n=1 Tax=Ancylomarina longa TaxID=2487017 RepID=A0A434B026_9BACT|nr:sigma-70 family RNA polymerase sigma factor [Ancylomarina longa]RUT80067.1 sigma-70 family RNA polymerase sigma factor [Ancylomarina longa]